MNKCEFCEEESVITFICPYCNQRFCRTHRKPEDHMCTEFDVATEESNELKTSLVETDAITPEESIDEIPDLVDQSDEINSLFEDQNHTDFNEISDANIEESHDSSELQYEASDDRDERDTVSDQFVGEILTDAGEKQPFQDLVSELLKVKTPLVILIIASIAIGALMGNLVSPSSDSDNLEERYEALYQYYNELQVKNQNLTIQLEEQSNRVEYLDNELNETKRNLNGLQDDWNKLFSTNIEYTYPTLEQLNNWLTDDVTDDTNLNEAYTRRDQAIELCLRARLVGWRLDAVSIHGEYGGTMNEYVYCIAELEPNIFVYIDPQTDEVWWTPYYEKITPNQVWDLEYRTNVSIGNIETIMDN